MELRPYPTVVHMLRETAARWPAREALVCGSERLSYAEYLAAVAGFANELVTLGARGDRVALVLGNETDGLSPDVRALCDGLLAIPMEGGVESLNVASAAAVAAFELLRRRSSPR